MTMWIDGNVKGRVDTALASVIELTALAGAEASSSMARDVVAVMGESAILGRKPRLAMRIDDTKGDAFGLDPVLIQADIANERYGIWGLNAVGDENIKAWEGQGGKGAPYGYYALLYSRMPTAEEWVKLNWSPGAEEHIKTYAPELYARVRVLRGFPDPSAGASHGVEIKPSLPPDWSSASAPKPTDADESGIVEMSIGKIRGQQVIWTATTPAESAKMTKGNPHPGVSIINPDSWRRVTGGDSDDAMEYPEDLAAQFTGLDGLRVLAMSAGDSSPRPANEELVSVMGWALRGDEQSIAALASIGIKRVESQRSGLFDWL